MAMRFLARGGIYIAGGGIAAKMIDRIRDGRVLQAYMDQGVSTEVVPRVARWPARNQLILSFP